MNVLAGLGSVALAGDMGRVRWYASSLKDPYGLGQAKSKLDQTRMVLEHSGESQMVAELLQVVLEEQHRVGIYSSIQSNVGLCVEIYAGQVEDIQARARRALDSRETAVNSRVNTSLRLKELTAPLPDGICPAVTGDDADLLRFLSTRLVDLDVEVADADSQLARLDEERRGVDQSLAFDLEEAIGAVNSLVKDLPFEDIPLVDVSEKPDEWLALLAVVARVVGDCERVPTFDELLLLMEYCSEEASEGSLADTRIVALWEQVIVKLEVVDEFYDKEPVLAENLAEFLDSAPQKGSQFTRRDRVEIFNLFAVDVFDSNGPSVGMAILLNIEGVKIAALDATEKGKDGKLKAAGAFYSPSKRTITLNLDEVRADDRGAYYTLFHEMFHAADHQYARKQGEKDSGSTWFRDSAGNTALDCIDLDIANQVHKDLKGLPKEIRNEIVTVLLDRDDLTGDDTLTAATLGISDEAYEGYLGFSDLMLDKFGATGDPKPHMINAAADTYTGRTFYKIPRGKEAYGHSLDYWSGDFWTAGASVEKEMSAELAGLTLAGAPWLAKNVEMLAESEQWVQEYVGQMSSGG